jgi:hypothetical protein
VPEIATAASTTAAAGEPPPAAADPAGAPPRRPAPEPAEALDLGALGGAVVADRLKDPRVLGGLLVLAFLLGRWSKR